MAVQFEFAPIPIPSDRKKKVRYYARVVNKQLVDSDYIAKEIQHACSLTDIDVKAVLDALNRSLETHLKEGRRVHLRGIGYFDVTLECPETRDPKKTRASSVHFKSVNFRADKELKYRIGNLKAIRSSAGNHSASLTEVEIDLRLTEFFATHQVLTRVGLQKICSMTRITAIRCINRLIVEKKLKNINTKSQPIYTPVPGHYRVSVDAVSENRP